MSRAWLQSLPQSLFATPMSTRTLALLIGGIVPALLLGLATLFQKLGTQAGIGTGSFLLIVGLTICVCGGAVCLVERDLAISRTALLHSMLFGLCWAAATAGIAISLKFYGGQLSQLVPLYNMNTLVAVLLGLVVLTEWKQVHAPTALLAAALIVAGGILAARA